MNVLIIQPPDQTPYLAPMESRPGDVSLLSPPWSLLCLESYLSERTRHQGELIDCRLFSDLEHELVAAVQTIPGPYLAVVNTSTANMGQCAAVLEIIKRRFPVTQTVVFGSHPSQFPDEALLPHADFAMVGDPEPILRNLLDSLGRGPRLRRVPGLSYDGSGTPAPYWVDTLKGFSLPDWEHVFWPAYQEQAGRGTSRVALRLSRGHTGEPADRAFGNQHEPLRTWSFDRVAANIQKCSPANISEVLIDDPPGFWTISRLNQWIAALHRVRNIQPWSLQLLPAVLTEDLARRLSAARCQRIRFVVPSCDPEIMTRFNCSVDEKDLAASMRMLTGIGLGTHTQFWVGGPEESSGEAKRLKRYLSTVGYASFSLVPFPYRLDAPIYQEAGGLGSTPSLDHWMDWAWDPWNRERPLALWGDDEYAEDVYATMLQVRNATLRSPRRLVREGLSAFLSQAWVRRLEQQAVNLLHAHQRPVP